jgi:hypothetical protein
MMIMTRTLHEEHTETQFFSKASQLSKELSHGKIYLIKAHLGFEIFFGMASEV